MQEFLSIAVGALAGFVLVVIFLLVVIPIHASAGLYVNNPTSEGPSGFHLFTRLAPGEVKIIERGSKLVRMISDTADKKFARKGDRNSPEFWEFVDSDSPEDPIEEIWLPLRWWARMVYDQTGLVFTGIYPFQKVREYKLERTALKRTEDRGAAHESDSNLVLTIKEDWSDHLRTRLFVFPMHIAAAETQGNVPLDIIGVAEMIVTNPYKAAYGIDRWDQAIINLVTNKINEQTRQLTLDEALTANNAEIAQRISNSVVGLRTDTQNYGIDILVFPILEINPVLDEAGKRAIQAGAIAIQTAKATRIDGEARADALTKINQANVAGGEHALETMQAEAFVRAATEAGKGGGTIILSSPQGGRAAGDPINKAILSELQKLNKSRST